MINIEDLARREELFRQGYWEIPDGLDTSNFDFNWRPDPYDRPYIHQFGTQWQKTGGPRFVIPENEGIKYQSHQHCIRLSNRESREWRPLRHNCVIDWSWHPDDTDPPYIYVFGNQWYDSVTMPTIQFRVRGATEKKYVTDVRATLLPSKTNWETPDDIADDFDYSWVPSPHEPVGFDYQFGTQHQKTGGPKYVTENSHTTKYCDVLKATKLPNENNRCWRPLVSNATIDYSWHPDDNDPPYIYVFGNQWYDSETMPTIQYRVKGATEKKYVTDVRATLDACMDNWISPDYITDFDYSWVPHPYDPPGLNYQFGTQWQKTGGPLYVIPNATTVKYCDIQRATKLPNKDDRAWRSEITNATIDYSWHPDDTEKPYIYVFGNQYYDSETMPTIYFHTKGATEKKFVNYISATLNNVENLIDTIEYTDSIFNKLIEHRFTKPFVHIKRSGNTNPSDIVKTGSALVHVIDNLEVVASENSIKYLYDKLEDCSLIKYHSRDNKPELLDIVFFSNNESCAEDNYNHLLSLNLPNRIVRVDGVQGRIASQQAAANSSNTEWYFLINAKLKVNKDFDFNWQPDRLKSRRHYIFKSTNPVNNLEYGHMAMVANNKTLTLNTKGYGLDFTMDSPTEVVDINSGVAVYNSSEWDTWRTAFREVIKLCYAKDSESKKRLETWSTVAEGSFAQDSIQGAKDAIDYYQSVNGDFEKLKLSYDWAWLREKYYK